MAPEGADLVQVLWCPFDGHGPQGAPGVHVRWRSSSECQEILTAPPLPEVVGFGGYLPEPCVIDPEQVVEHEYVEHLDSDLQERIEAGETQLEEETGDDEEEAEEEAEGAILTYHHDLSVAAGWKVGGYAKWNVTGPACATCSCGSSMRLFLTVATYEWDGIISSWTPLEDRQAPSPQDIKHPTEVVVGRGGSLNIFTCAADPRHEHSVFLR
ncbi:hypothetical protein ABZY02_29880 [Streptomyces sp. NPDC006649]|uniref:hypothetical protein n=1 Tax=Streptomyces sp. NPDC006649 TaxID=3156896 RepID=UPI0033A14B9E